MLERLARRLPGAPALVVSDSDALTPYMSHVVPGCEFLFATTPGEVCAFQPPGVVVMSVVPGALQPL